MKLRSSTGVRQFLNGLIRCVNRHLPMEERIELLPVIAFREDPELEAVLHSYLKAVLDGYAEWHDGLGKGDPAYKTASARIEEIEEQYEFRLNDYLKPYENIDPVTVSPQYEWHRARVAQHRAYNRRT